MKKKVWRLGTAFMLVMVLVAAVVWIDRSELTARAEAENGDGITLPHVHSEEGGVCYHHHSGDTAAGGGCYTVPVSCGGSITAKTEETYCGDMNVWYGPNADHTESKWWATCKSCGALFGPHDVNNFGAHHMRTETYYSCDRCGARHGGGGTCTNVTGYETGCAMDEQILDCADTTCGSYHITCNDTAAGLESTTLTANVSSQGAGASVTSYLWSTGDTAQTITVTQNGTYSCEVTYTDQKSGAVSTAAASYAVTNLDNTPPEVSLSYSPSAPTSTGTTIHVDATDNVGVTGYSFDGVTFSQEQELYVTENGSYTAYATDASGNIGSAVITVDNIDHEAPEIVSVTKSAEGQYINGDIEIRVSARDRVSDGYTREVIVEYSLDGENWNSNGEFSFTGNGTQEILVRDAAGNISAAPVTVYQDTTPPRVGGTQNPQGWTKDAVCLTVTASDSQSGIPEWAYKWMDGDWNPASYINVTENGSYQVTVRDGAGNTASYTFRVTQIDHTPPKADVYLATADWRDGSNMICVAASDAESGLSAKAYSYDGGATWTDVTEYEITDSGDYCIMVRDAVGNMTESRIHAEKMTVLPDQEDVAAEPPTGDGPKKGTAGELPSASGTEIQMLPPAYPASQPATETEQADYEPKIILSISVPKASSPEVEALEEEVPEVEIQDLESPKASSPGAADPWLLLLQILTSVLWGICLGILFFLLWKIRQKAVLYQKGEDGKYHFAGRMNVKYLGEGKGFSVCINDPDLGEQIAKGLKQDVWQIQFGRRFAKKHISEKLKVVLSTDDWTLAKIERRVNL